MAVIIKRPKAIKRVEANKEKPQLSKGRVLKESSPKPQEVEFSWTQPIKEYAEEKGYTEPQPKEEYVAITTEKKASFGDYIRSGIFGLILLAGFAVGGKSAFDYIQESESLRIINLQLEKENPSDLPDDVKAELSLFKKDEPAAEVPKFDPNPPQPVAPDKKADLPDDALTDLIKTDLYYISAFRNDGKVELRTGGTVGWRTHNPGEFGYGDFAKETGAIGKYKQYAIYPTQKMGMKAIETYLFQTNAYSQLSINEAMKKFYNKSKSKAERVARAISVALNKSRYKTKMYALTNSQREKVLAQIAKEENNLKGIVRVFDDKEQFDKKGF